jgi:membrane fusion protein (multidrug efflux system)
MATANDARSEISTAPNPATLPASSPVPAKAAAPPPSHRWRTRLLFVAALVALAAGAYILVPILTTSLNTVSTDDAYVNSHVTFVAPRVASQVVKVLVDDNMRVKKGDVLVQLDREPNLIQVRIRKAAVDAAQADLFAARATVRGLEALARSQRWQLQMTIEQARNKVAMLRADVATYDSKKASRTLAQGNLERGEELSPSGAISKEDVQTRRRALKVADAEVEQALQTIYADRVYLGLPAQPAKDQTFTDVPTDLDQTFSSVRSSLANLLQTTSQIGLPLPGVDAPPQQVLDEFRDRDASGDIDRVLKELIPNAPGVKQADAKLLEAQRDLELAQLNLLYCDVVSEIDGVVTRRNVNPGNNVQIGQSLMAVRSLDEIWIDANFKETQLRHLRIGQRVRLDVDMYGGTHQFAGRITGFTMGTGSTLALLPSQNATGNYVKVVQRLPVRVELTDYDPDKDALFVGLSVTPYVYYKEAPTGPHAGDLLQPNVPLPQVATDPKP